MQGYDRLICKAEKLVNFYFLFDNITDNTTDNTTDNKYEESLYGLLKGLENLGPTRPAITEVDVLRQATDRLRHKTVDKHFLILELLAY